MLVKTDVSQNFKQLLIIFFSSILLVFIWFRGGYILGAAESGLPFYELNIAYETTRWSWAIPALGNATGLIVASSPTYFILTKIQNFGVPGFLIEAMIFWLILATSGTSVYFLTKEFFPELKPGYLTLTSFFYWFNPFFLVNVWNRFLYNHMFFMAFLPLALLLFKRGLSSRRLYFALLTSCASAVFAYSFTSVAFVILFFGLVLFTLVFFFSKKKTLFFIKYFLVFIFSFVALNFWWLSQIFSFVQTGALSQRVATSFALEDNLGTLSVLSKGLGNFSTTTRFLHKDFFLQGPSWTRIFNFPLFVFFEFMVPCVVFYSLYKFRKKKETLYFGSLFVIILFLMKGNEPPLGEIFEYFFKQFTILQVYRNPFEKFGLLLPLVSAPIFVFGLQSISLGLKKRLGEFLLLGAYLFILIFWGFPFWTGLVFTRQDPITKKLETYEVKVPEYYRTLNTWLNKEEGEFRFLSLPLNGEGMTYDWDKPYSGVELSSSLFERPSVSFNTTIPFYSDFVASLTAYQLDKRILRFFPFFSGKFILLRQDVDYKARKMANPQVIKEKLDNWRKEDLLEEKFNSGNLSVYEVDDKYVWPKIYITKNVVITNNYDLANIANFISDFPETKWATVDSNFTLTRQIPYKTLIFSPDEAFIQKVVQPTPKDFSDDDILARLFHAKHLPDRWFYPFIRLKEKIIEAGARDYDGWLLYKTGILGKRAVEVYKSKKEGIANDIILKAEKDYEKELEDLKIDLLATVGRDTSVSEVVRESLVYQWILLERSGSNLSSLLSKLLSSWGLKPKFELPVSFEDYAVFDFKIPVGGRYKINSELLSNKTKLYLEGIELNIEEGKDIEIELNPGEHEIAFQIDEKEFFTEVYNKEKDYYSLENLPHFTLDIPDLPTTYRVSFDYRFVRGESFKMLFVQDIEDENSPVFSSDVGKEKLFHGWRHFEKDFTTTQGADKGVLNIVPTKEKICQKNFWGKSFCKEENHKFEVEIKNFQLSQVEIPDVTLTWSEKEFSSPTYTKLIWQKKDPTKYALQIEKVDSDPEVLVFSELFNRGWKLEFENAEKVQEDKHFLVNGFANGWLLDEPGVYNVVLKFSPQEILEVGKKVSTLFILAALTSLPILLWRKRY